RPIGIFDSGMGGVSVLARARALLPAEDFLYYGDNGYAPYGIRPPQQVMERVRWVAGHLLERGAKALVIACNTATSVAAAELRAELALPVIGMEPALKPASLCRHGGHILVMATPMTLALPKFAALMERYGQDAVPLPCAGLVEFVERCELEGDTLYRHLARIFGDWPRKPVDAVVLGCTHYLYLRRAIAALFPNTPLLDGNQGTARQLERLLAERGLLRAGDHQGTVVLETSGDEKSVIPLMRRLLRHDAM
ncbi:MAG: glutamate racemase, partial [Clostridia bacterium]|nr:glutamate racemase [Clostridia bacterium]